jgi:hypothetical protein
MSTPEATPAIHHANKLHMPIFRLHLKHLPVGPVIHPSFSSITELKR